MKQYPYKTHLLQLESSPYGCFECFFQKDCGCYRPDYFAECRPFTKFVDVANPAKLSDVVCHEDNKD